MAFEKSLCLVSLILSPSLSSKSLRGRSPKQGLINIELVSLNLSPFLSSESLRGRSPKQGLINFPSISAAKLPLFPHIAYRQILTFYLKLR